MQLGFVSAILGDLSLPDVLAFASDEGYSCVEVMCWPPGGADRRYAGVTHVDVTTLDDDQVGWVHELIRKTGVSISGLGYYPNPLDPSPEHRQHVAEHLKTVMAGAARLGIDVVNTFIGRDHAHPLEHSWDLFRAVWPDLVSYAERHRIKLGIENCPMLFSKDEWPGGKNLAVSPAIWRKVFAELQSRNVGLNLDPSHLIWLHIDPVRCIREFGDRIIHVHAKDTRIDPDRLHEVGVLGLGWHTPKLPGMGDVNWGAFFSALSDSGYKGAVCVEVEDRAFEGDLTNRKRALRLCRRFLEQWV